MPQANARLLFIPVSGPRGMGEYARCLCVATALAQRVPALEMRFVLSREAPYAADTPFATTLLPASATFHSREVCALIRDYQPRVVMFDNAGRTVQLRAARSCGARIVYVSSRRRQRARAFRLKWMRLIDEHWIAYPRFIAGAPTRLERLKLRLLERPRLRYIDTLLPPSDPAQAAAGRARFALEAREYVLCVPGGGSAHPGAENAPAIVAAAARALARRGYPTLLVGTGAGGDAGEPALLRVAPRLPLPELCELIRTARLVVANGGDTLLQVLACTRPCVAVPIARDQAARIDRCVRAGLAVRAELQAQAIESAAVRLLEEPSAAAHLSPLAGAQQVRNGMEDVLGALQGML
jgi:predicted glycosyltransferase